MRHTVRAALAADIRSSSIQTQSTCNDFRWRDCVPRNHRFPRERHFDFINPLVINIAVKNAVPAAWNKLLPDIRYQQNFNHVKATLQHSLSGKHLMFSYSYFALFYSSWF